MKQDTTRGIRRAREESGRPGAGKGRRENVRGSGIYPATGPLPPSRGATVKSAGSLGRRQSSARTTTRGIMVRQTRTGQKTSVVIARTPSKRAGTHREIASSRGQTPRDLRRKDWERFLEDFSVEHEGWPTQMKVFQPDQTSRIEAHDLPLEGISVDLKAVEAVTEVMLGTEARDHITHIIPHTTRITELTEDEIEIEGADRGRTIVVCREKLD